MAMRIKFWGLFGSNSLKQKDPQIATKHTAQNAVLLMLDHLVSKTFLPISCNSSKVIGILKLLLGLSRGAAFSIPLKYIFLNVITYVVLISQEELEFA